MAKKNSRSGAAPAAPIPGGPVAPIPQRTSGRSKPRPSAESANQNQNDKSETAGAQDPEEIPASGIVTCKGKVVKNLKSHTAGDAKVMLERWESRGCAFGFNDTNHWVVLTRGSLSQRENEFLLWYNWLFYDLLCGRIFKTGRDSVQRGLVELALRHLDRIGKRQGGLIAEDLRESEIEDLREALAILKMIDKDIKKAAKKAGQAAEKGAGDDASR